MKKDTFSEERVERPEKGDEEKRDTTSVTEDLRSRER